MDCVEKAKAIKTIILDVDGVMTDGMLGFTAEGEPMKTFNVRDGHTVRMALRVGLKVGILSGRYDNATLHRARDLGLSFLYQGVKDKKATFARLLIEQKLKAKECLYIGDDVVDIPVMRRVGIAATVGDAAEEVIEYAHWTSRYSGGKGAVREIIIRLLQVQGKWDALMERYLQ